MRRRRGLALGSVTLAAALAANSLLGPLVAGVIRYRFSETLVHQGVGLDFVSLAFVAPILAVAAVLAWRGHAAAPVLALGPAAYSAYMAVQYVVGPEYTALPGNNERFFLLHLGLLILGLTLAARAWAAADPAELPPSSARGERLWGCVLLLLGALLLLRYAPILVGLTTGGLGVPEYRENPTSFLLIAVMDLGVFTPAAIAAGFGLRRGQGWAKKALHGVVGWLGLVGPAVAAMAVTMRLAGDPTASPGRTVAFVGVGAALAALSIRLLAPLFRGVRREA